MIKIFAIVFLVSSVFAVDAIVVPVDDLAPVTSNANLFLNPDTEQASNIAKLYPVVSEYVIKHTTPDDDIKFEKLWRNRLNQAEFDRMESFSEEKYTVLVLQTFCEENRNILKSIENVDFKKVVYACRLFKLCYEKNFEFPSRIKSKLTDSNTSKIANFLREH